MITKSNVTIKKLLEAGVHFGHKSAAWNPKMSKYIFIKRKGVHIIDLQKTSLLLERAFNYIKNIVSNGGKILFVGTKKQAREIIRNKVKETDHYFMTHRWVGGLLTNFEVVRQSIERLKKFNDILSDEIKQKNYIKKDLFKMKKKRDHLDQTFTGVLDMKKVPDIIFVVDTFNEDNCVKEANLSGIPICGMVDTNSNPENIDVVIPSNDDAIRSINLFVSIAVDAIMAGEKILKSNQSEMSLFEEQIKEEVKLEKEKKIKENETLTIKTPNQPKTSNSPSNSSELNNSNSINIKTKTEAPKNSEKQKIKESSIENEVSPEKKISKPLEANQAPVSSEANDDTNTKTT